MIRKWQKKAKKIVTAFVILLGWIEEKEEDDDEQIRYFKIHNYLFY